MKIIFITGGLSPYRVAFCDTINNHLTNNNLGELKLLLLSEENFNSNYDNKVLLRPYIEFLKGKTIVFKDNTTRIMINPDIAKKVKSEKPDFIILGGSWTHPSTWMLLHHKNKIKVPIYFWAESHFHNGLKRKSHKKWKEFIKRVIYNKFDGFFTPGIYATEAIKATNCKNSSNCLRLPNLVENSKYIQASSKRQNKQNLRSEYNLPFENTVFFTPARLVDLKGILEFIENGKLAMDKKCTWVIAGIGPLENKIRKKSKQYGIDIRLVGFINQDQVIDYLALSDWFLLPSLSDPNPLSVIESLWASMPVAVSKYVGNNPETVIDGENGYVFDTLSKNSVQSTIKKMIYSSVEWKNQAGEKSLNIAQTLFDIEKEANDLIESIERILQNDKK